MPRYFMSILDGDTLIPDLEGDELRSELEACNLALDTVREMTAFPTCYGDQETWAGRSLILTDQAGRQLLVLPFAIDIPARHGSDYPLRRPPPETRHQTA